MEPNFHDPVFIISCLMGVLWIIICVAAAKFYFGKAEFPGAKTRGEQFTEEFKQDIQDIKEGIKDLFNKR